MQGSLDIPPVVLRGDRRRALLLVLGAALFVALGLMVRSAPATSVVSWLAVGFFGLCGLVGVARLIVPPRLEIGPSGLVQKVLWRTSIFAWKDVYNFRPIPIGLTNKAVGFDYLNMPPRRRALSSLNTAISGSQGCLQIGWEVGPEDLSDLLNLARERWLEASRVAPQVPATASQRSRFIGSVAATRIDRRTYWIATGAVFAIAFAVTFIPGLARGIAPLATLVFIRLFASRLHDFGRSGWWQLILYAVQVPTIVLLMTAADQPTGVASAAGLFVQLVFTTVLGAIPGDRGDNRFGPPPSEPTPIAASEVFR